MQSAATIYVKHLEPMTSFYEGCFGMHMVVEAPGDYRILESASWSLSLVQVPNDVAATIVLADPPVRREQAPIKLCFEIASIAAARATVTTLGGQVDDHAWEFRGYHHCDFTDPEGNVIELREAVRA